VDITILISIAASLIIRISRPKRAPPSGDHETATNFQTVHNKTKIHSKLVARQFISFIRENNFEKLKENPKHSMMKPEVC